MPLLQGLPLLKLTPRLIRQPLSTLQQLQREHGDVVTLEIGRTLVFLVHHPAAIQQVLLTNQRNYTKETIQFKTFKIVAGNGLLNSDGAYWLQQRRLLQPAFHRQRLERVEALIIAETKKVAERWAEGGARDMEHEMLLLSLPIISQALFSRPMGGETESLVNAAMSALDYVMFRAQTPFTPPLHWPLPIHTRYKQAMTQLETFIADIITEHRRHPQRYDDLVAMLLAFRDEAGEPLPDLAIRDEIMTMIVAGHETVATGLTWAWYLLAQNPDIARQLREELHAVLGGRAPTSADLPHLPYLNYFLNETWRLYPPAWVISRQAVADDTLMTPEGAYPIPAGSLVVISPYVLHRSATFWPQPDQCQPQRFAQEPAHKFAYLPFGGGPRLCIGNRLAEMESALILGTLAQQFDPQLLRQEVTLRPLVTIRPKGGLPMLINRRN